ncbi:MAG TPA: c-type cytochrome [Anaerolineales bacterium]|nr:c-type cytochrome [Anaerolineales bacterium]
MRRPEWIARTLIVFLLVAAVAVPLVLRLRSPLIHARMAEAGGWSVDDLRAAVGVPLHLRLISDDVVHGFAVGKLDAPAVDVMPGKITNLTVLFDQPGTYTFFCTRWCGLNHWRMRGTITVDGSPSSTRAADQPLYASLGIDLDAPRNAPATPAHRPVAELPAKQLASTLAAYSSMEYYRTHSPVATWQELRRDPDLHSLGDDALWDATAWIWRSNTTPQSVARGAQLFATNCAACHGPAGDGSGVFADDLEQAGASAMHSAMNGGTMFMQRPADLSNPVRMLAASPALLQGKILRGGMGTGMPSWGPIFTDEQIWDLVSYLYTFQFDYP